MNKARDAVNPESFKIPEIVVEESVEAVPNTTAPVPVSSDSDDRRFAEENDDAAVP